VSPTALLPRLSQHAAFAENVDTFCDSCTQCKHAEILSFFDEVFGAKYKMDKIRVEPNSVFSATDNAVMDPAYGIHIEGLVNCLKSSKLVEHYKEQVKISHVTSDGCNRVHSQAECCGGMTQRAAANTVSPVAPGYIHI
jgi:hypothetical protein